jgi:hypothetical protein
MRELDGHPSEVSVAEHYDLAGLTLAVVHGPFVAPSPPGFEGSEYLVYERGDRPRPEDVSMAEFADSDLVLFNGYGVAEHGTELAGLSRETQAEVVSGGTAATSTVFDATEYDADTDAGDDADTADDTGERDRGADGTFTPAEGD